MADLTDLLGKVLVKIEREGDESLTFHAADQKWVMYHPQACCETVEIEEVHGDLDDLIGSPILLAEEVVSNDDPAPDRDYSPESATWTFYKLATVKGHVTIRWFGQGNGYYSGSVCFGPA